MDAFFHVLAKLLQALFVVGVAGCLITVPVVALKFASVLWEKDEDETHGPADETHGPAEEEI
jgi:hypothetical protein